MNLTQKVQHGIRQHRLLQTDDRVVAAVSGGIDSVVMLDVLLSLPETLKLKIAVAHFNHKLRGAESDGDEEFVRNLAASSGIECYVERTDTAAEAASQKRSIQETARDLRYDFFSKLRSSFGFTKIATAHNANDNAETVLFHMIRGAGVRGLSGIPVWRKDNSVIRPLLNSTRDEIESYANEQSLTYRVDSTNLKSDYTRNFLRQSVIPMLRNVNPNFIATVCRMAELFGELDRYIIDEARRGVKRIVLQKAQEGVIIDIDQLHAQPIFLQEYIVFLAAKDFSRSDIDFSSVKAIMNLSYAETGSSCTLSKECTVFRDRNHLLFRHSESPNVFYYAVEPNKQYDFHYFRFSSIMTDAVQFGGNGRVEYIDADRLGHNLALRSWSDGDWFYPLGMDGKKKLSDFFIDAKVSLYQKNLIPVFESDGTVVWICGERLDDRFKITERTNRILKLEYSSQIPDA